MGAVEKWITGLTALGMFMFVVFNANNVVSLGNGLAKDAITYTGGLATIGGGGAAA